ncbi:MAG: porin [Gemmatimonadales bacterium]
MKPHQLAMPALAALLTLATAGLGVDLLAQEAGEAQEESGAKEPPKLWIDPIGLVRAGLRVEPEDAPQNTGFDLFDARLGVEGGFGSILEYIVHAGLEPRAVDKEIEFLDVALAVTFMPELHFDVGLYKAPFSREELVWRPDIKFESRAQAVNAIAPGRQVGAGLSGTFLEERLEYGVGLFNGNGKSLENDNNSFLYAGRVQFNNVGPVGFRDEFVIQVGANAAFSKDSAADLSRMGGAPAAAEELSAFRGDRFLWGFDLSSSYRGFFADAEFLRAKLDPLAAEAANLVAQGGYVQGGYRFLGGFLEGLVRYDAFDPIEAEDSDYLLIGANLYYLYHFRFEMQYAIGLHNSPPTPELSDGQFIFFLQLRL